MNPRLQKILLLSAYPAFYAFCLMMFAYVSAPYDRIKHALVAGFNKGDSPLDVEIEDLSWSWHFPGLTAKGIRLKSAGAPKPEGTANVAAPAPAPAEAMVSRAEYTIDDAYVRVSILKLLIGTVELGFGIDAAGGDIGGKIATSGDERDILVDFDDADVGKVPFLADAVGLPLKGSLNGSIDLTLPEQKFSKAEGSIELEITELVIGDGKAKIRQTIAMPALEAGTLKLLAQASGGRLDITELSAAGTDLELSSQGKIRLMDRVDASIADLDLRFKFSDKYKAKNDVTRGLFGEPGSKVPGVFDLDPKIAQAKKDDGFYAWHLSGPIAHLSMQPGVRGAGAGLSQDRERPARERRRGRRGPRVTSAVPPPSPVAPTMPPIPAAAAPPPPPPMAPEPPPPMPQPPPPEAPLPPPPQMEPAPAPPEQQQAPEDEGVDEEEEE